jgi:murein DD-endopeptidase MepM/ murein hydrolase activator NlpD
VEDGLKALRKAWAQIAKRARKRYSVIVLSGPEGRLRQFSIPGVLVPAAVGVAAAGLVGGGAVILDWASQRAERLHLAALELENLRLGEQLTDMRRSVDAFEKQMSDQIELVRTFRSLANLSPIPEDVHRLGIGGPPPFAELADEASPSPLVREARDTLNRLDELNRQARFQSDNFQEMVENLRATKDDLDRRPSISPIREGIYSSGYGMRTDPFTGLLSMHRGLDFSGWPGTPVVATAGGVVLAAGEHETLGLYIEIDHGNGILTRYGHNRRLLVKAGQQVERGDPIAELGSTGRSTSPHCHYEVELNGQHVNPWRFILDGGPGLLPRA